MQKKMKKNEKKCKKMQKNLHISKKSCTFAPDFKTSRSETPKINTKKLLNYDTNKLHKVLPREWRKIECFCNSRTRNSGEVASDDKLRRKV